MPVEPVLHQLTIPTPFAVGDVHIYVLKGDTVTLVDTGPRTKEAWESVTAQLSAIGLQPEDIDQIVLTHHHADHAGLVEEFRHAVLYSHQDSDRFLTRTQSFMDMHDFFYREFFKQLGLPEAYLALIEKMKDPLKPMGNRGADAYITEGDTLPGLDGWRVIETHGHSQGHVSLSSAGEMIGGDILLGHISSNPLIEPPFGINTPRPVPQLQYNDSLKKIAALNPGRVWTGHGDPVLQPLPLIQERLKKQHERAMLVKSMLADKETTAFELCQKLFPSLFKKQLGLTLSETMGQLDYLLANGEIKEAGLAHGAIIYRAEGVTEKV
ncbi:MBL fold metallo-hydrolase [Jeotgalibacillus sp. R-1-5s-1]|uniref:MBL fold metallo-hydrolase n=1 Tax=Jeotgalibacillus sp. R-1-5s-1 TaxID=2555897 RepID=UPI00106C6B00|nr:MBL fold metallo-hydrolase [Jeotgalibacillus sp. R-1-5s-1]TFD92210.1 MBL fold metallo-hydrolase [Jeotgalibacillus sp. R-1-5s-1]